MDPYDNLAGVEYRHVREDIAREIMRLGELQLQAQLEIAIASNQRAATLCGIFTTASIAMIGTAGVLIEKGNGYINLSCASLAGALFLFVSAILCVAALWPVGAHLPGNRPGNWLNVETLTGSFVETMLYEAENYHFNLEHNKRVNERSARFLKAGVILGCMTPAITLLSFILIASIPESWISTLRALASVLAPV